MEAHVLDHAQDGCLHLPEHLNATPHVGERHLLRRRDDDASRDRHLLRERQLDVAGPGREVDHEHVELAPDDVPQKLGHELRHHRSAPDDRRVLADEHPHRDRADAVPLDRHELPALARADLRVDAEHERHARAVDVGIEEPDGRTERAEREREVGGDRGLADAALPARHGDDVGDAGDGLRTARTRRRGGGRHDLDGAGDAGHRRDRYPHGILDLPEHLGLRSGRSEMNRDPGGRHLDVLDDPERHDVAGEARIGHTLQTL